jgi:hypothetical protein
VLVDHADAAADSVSGGVEVGGTAVDKHLPRFRLVKTVEDIHQRRLSRPILAQQSVNLAGTNSKINLVVSDNPRESLDDSFHFNGEVGHR